MPVVVRADIKDATRYLNRVQRKQVPFAIAHSLTSTAFDARKNEQKGMQRSLRSPTPFTLRGVQVVKATKRNLTAIVRLEMTRAAYLHWQIEGGRRMPARKVIVIGKVRRNQYGNTPGFRSFRARMLRQKNVFENDRGIFRRTRKGVTLLALYVKSASYRRRYDFHGIARKTATARFPIQFRRSLTRALATAR